MDLKAKSNYVKSLIVREGLTLGAFAKKIGISQPYLSQILNESKNPSIMVAFKIADGLGVEITDIFFTDNHRYINSTKELLSNR